MAARTARIPATHGTLPDDAATIVACFDGPHADGGARALGGRDLFADPFLDGPATLPLSLVLIRDAASAAPGHSPGEAGREHLAEAVAEAARSVGARVREVRAEGRSAVARLASLVALGDYATTYAALGLGVDPVVSAHVADLRDRTS